MGFFEKISRAILKTPPKSAANLSRNEPCWCGSGKKYKKCHYESDRRHFLARGNSCKTPT